MKCYYVDYWLSAAEPQIFAGLAVEAGTAVRMEGLTASHGYRFRTDGNGNLGRLEGSGDGARARLSIALATELNQRLLGNNNFSLENPRLLRCDVEQRAELWLVPESQATREQALVLIGCWETISSGGDVHVEVSIEGGGEVLFNNSIARRRRPDNQSETDITVLARLSPGARITLAFTTRVIADYPFWIRKIRTTRWEKALFLDKDGKLGWETVEEAA